MMKCHRLIRYRSQLKSGTCKGGSQFFFLVNFEVVPIRIPGHPEVKQMLIYVSRMSACITLRNKASSLGFGYGGIGER